MTNKYNPWASYHTEYTRRLERDRAIVERDEARRLFYNERERVEKAEQKRDDAIAERRGLVANLAMVERQRDKYKTQSNKDNANFRKFYTQWAKAEREKQELVKALKEISNLHGHRYIDARIIAKAALAKLE